MSGHKMRPALLRSMRSSCKLWHKQNRRVRGPQRRVGLGRATWKFGSQHDMACMFRTCAAFAVVAAGGVLLLAVRSWTVLPGQVVSDSGAPERLKPNEQRVFSEPVVAERDQSSQADFKAKPLAKLLSVEGAGAETALRQCVLDTKVFASQEVDAMVRVLLQPQDLSAGPEEGIPMPLVFTQTHEGSIGEAFHHAWSGLGCGKMFFTKSDVRVRPGRQRCYSLWAGSESHLYPWAFFDPHTRKREEPRLDKIIGIRGYLPFGACRFLAPGCSYTAVLLDPGQAQLACKSGTSCDVDNFQTRMLAGDGALNSQGSPCFAAETCVHGKIGDAEIKQAIQNLAFHYPVFGLGRDLKTFAQRLHRVYGYLVKLIDLPDQSLEEQAVTQRTADFTVYNFAACVLAAGGPRFAV